MNTNIPGLAELQERRAQEERQRRAAIINGQLLPFSVNTNVPGLAEAQARAYSIAHEAQPQDAETLRDGLPANVDRRRPIGTNIWGDIGYVDTQKLIQPWKPTGNLLGLLRHAAVLGLGAADFSGKILMGLPAHLFGNIGDIQENITNINDKHFQKIADKQGIPAEAVNSALERLNRDSIATETSKMFLDWGSTWNSNMQNAYQWVVGDNPRLIDRAEHSAGTALAFSAISAGLGLGAQAALGVSPTVANILGGIAGGGLEAGAESGSLLIDKYAENPDKYKDALKAANISYSFNAPTDMLLDTAGNLVSPYFGGTTGSLKNIVKGMLGETVKENLQEAKQTAIEKATSKIYDSSDFSVGNVLSNMWSEAKNIPQYLKEQASEITLSTLISGGILGGLGLASRGRKTTTSQKTDTRIYMEQLTNARNSLQEELTNAQIAQAAHPDNADLSSLVDDLTTQINGIDREIADVQDELDIENFDLYPSDDDTTPPEGQNGTQDEQLIPPFNAKESNTAAAEEQDDLDAKPRWEKIGLFDESEADDGETYNQTMPGNEDDTDAGDFIFTYRPRNGSNQSYKFRVTATGGVAPTSRYAYSPTTRGKRYSGRSLELRNKLGRVIARYSPYLDYFRILGNEKAHPQGWGKALESAFRANLNQYLSRGGFLDSSGNLLSDGNEDFRRAWDRRRQNDAEAFSEGFQSDFVQPEDFVGAVQGQQARPTITANYDGNTHTLTVLPISDKVIDAIDERGQTVGRYDAENSKFFLASPFSSQSWSRELGRTLEQTFRKNIGSYLNNDTSGNLSRQTQNSFHTLTVQHNGETHQLTVEPHDYNDSRKARYGTVLEIKDEQGRTVARYSPKNFMFAVSPKFRGQEWTQGIAQALGQNINNILGDNNTHPILPDPASLIPNSAPKPEQQAETRRSPRSKKGIADRIREVLGESYNQNTEGDSTGTDNSQYPSSGKVRTLTVEHKGKRHTFTVHEGEFSDKHARHKKLFGKYLEMRDSNGKSIARYSVSGDKFSAAPGTDSSLASAVESELRDKLGAMLRTGRSDTPHSKTAKPTEKKSFSERLHDFVFGQEGIETANNNL